MISSAAAYRGDEPAGNQWASRAYGPADQGHACRADGKLKVSAPLAGRRIEPPGKTERAVLRWQLELPLLRPVRAAVPYRDRHIYTGATAMLGAKPARLPSAATAYGVVWTQGSVWPGDTSCPVLGFVEEPELLSFGVGELPGNSLRRPAENRVHVDRHVPEADRAVAEVERRLT